MAKAPQPYNWPRSFLRIVLFPVNLSKIENIFVKSPSIASFELPNVATCCFFERLKAGAVPSGLISPVYGWRLRWVPIINSKYHTMEAIKKAESEYTPTKNVVSHLYHGIPDVGRQIIWS